MKLGDKAHNISPKVLPKVFIETKSNPVRTWGFVVVTIPHGWLHFCLRKMFG
jgi:hypothetical protein